MEKGQKIILRSNNNPKRWVNKVRSPGRERGNLTSPSAQDLWIYVTHGAAGAAPSRTRSILGNVWEGSFTSAAETSDSRWVFPKKAAWQQVTENLTSASQHAGCDSSAGKESGSEKPWTAPGSAPAWTAHPGHGSWEIPALDTGSSWLRALSPPGCQHPFIAAFRTAEAK